MSLRSTVIIAVLLASNALPSVSLAQPANPEFASNRIIVKVLPGVEPQALVDGCLSFRYVGDTDLPQEEVVAAELAIADAMEQWAVTSVDPMIGFPIQAPALAAQTGLDRLYTVSVPEGTDTAAMVQQFATFPTHLEFASVA